MGWTARPTAVLAMDSATRPLLIRSVAARLAQIGRLTDLGVLGYRAGHRPVTAANSAYRVAGLRDAWEPPAPIDADRCCWSTISPTPCDADDGGRVVRRAGASAVLPFALAAVRENPS